VAVDSVTENNYILSIGLMRTIINIESTRTNSSNVVNKLIVKAGDSDLTTFHVNNI
jgi:hypothetical protein